MAVNILNAQQIKDWDQFTIQHEPVSSIDLMERAATKCFDWIDNRNWNNKVFKIFCGKGNNGGDGLALARMLSQNDYKVFVFILESGKQGSNDFQINLQRLHDISLLEIHFVQSKDNFPQINEDEVIVDALFGSGLNKPLEGLAGEVVKYINLSSAVIVSIDLPSGLFIDQSSKRNQVVKANYTLTFQCYKLALLMQENASFIGEVHVLEIGLHPDFLNTQKFNQFFVVDNVIKQIYQPRNAFAHKGNFGHALLIAGSYGKMGAAVLAAKSCLHSGVGLLTCYLPKCGYEIMQTALPEAMVMTDENQNTLSQLPGEIEKYSAIGIGPGIGTADETKKLISFVIRRYKKPLVIDADALNCLSHQKDLLGQLSPLSILTPHPKEFDRLFGDHENDFARLETAKQKSEQLNIVIVLKSHHTLIATPSGDLFFNSTGNAGMAKGGSGDVLTGIITALISQNYSVVHAAVFGVYIHGLSGDFAADTLSQEYIIATDVIDFLTKAFLQIKNFSACKKLTL